jgi:hypothetical protein
MLEDDFELKEFLPISLSEIIDIKKYYNALNSSRNTVGTQLSLTLNRTIFSPKDVYRFL